MASEADNPLEKLFATQTDDPHAISEMDALELLDNTAERTTAFVEKFWAIAHEMTEQAKASLADATPEERQYRLSKLNYELTQRIQILVDFGLQLKLKTSSGGYYFTTSRVDGKPVPLGHQDGSYSVSGGITDIDFLEAIETRRGVKIEDPDERNARYNDVPSLVLGGEEGLYQYVIPIQNIQSITPTKISGKAINNQAAA